MSDDVKIPSISDLLWPVLKATQTLGGSAARDELMEHARGVAGITDKQIAVVYSAPTGKSKALHRVEWAIYWLKAMGVLESSRGGASAPAGAPVLLVFSLISILLDDRLTSVYRPVQENRVRFTSGSGSR